MIPSNNWTYRGYTMKQLDELIERSERLYQRNGPVAPVEVILPARLTNGMLEQFRAVVREELDREEESEDDSSPVVISPVKYYDLQFEGHSISLEAEFEHEGKLYKGTLYFVKEIEK